MAGSRRIDAYQAVIGHRSLPAAMKSTAIAPAICTDMKTRAYVGDGQIGRRLRGLDWVDRIGRYHSPGHCHK